MSRTPGLGCFARDPGPVREVTLCAPVLTNGAPLAIDPAHRFVSPRTEHLLGTDHLGRDVVCPGSVRRQDLAACGGVCDSFQQAGWCADLQSFLHQSRERIYFLISLLALNSFHTISSYIPSRDRFSNQKVRIIMNDFAKGTFMPVTDYQ